MGFFKTDIGKDCINLDLSTCKWLGERMLAWSENCNTHPSRFPTKDDWTYALKANGEALLGYYNSRSELEDFSHKKLRNAQEAFRFFADHLLYMWD
jgi:hypothetical protein